MAGVTAAQLQVVVGGKTKDAETALNSINEKVKKQGGFFQSALSSALGYIGGAIGFTTVAGAVGAVTDQLKDCVQASMNEQQAMALTNNVLQSTHDVSGMTASAVLNLADSISNIEPVSQNAVEVAENMMLTFTNIGKRTFPQATQAAVDMATFFNNGMAPSAQQLQAVTIQLGKALNDPIKGVTALQRVGVTLDAQQKELIKTYMKHGDVARAQGVILGELKREFGGAGKAAGSTMTGALQIANNALEKMKAKIGDALMPVLAKFATLIGPIVSSLASQLGPVLLAVSDFISSDLMPALQALMPVFGTLMSSVQILATAFLNQIQPALSTVAGALQNMHGPGIDVQSMMTGVHSAVKALYPIMIQLGGVFSKIVTLFVTQVLPVLESLAKMFFTQVLPALSTIANFIITQVVPVVMNLVSTFVTSLLPIIKTIVSVIITDVVPAFMGIVQSIMKNVWPSVKQLITVLGKLWEKISPVLIPVLQFLGALLKNVLGPILSVVIVILGVVVGAIAGFIGIIVGAITWVQNILSILGKLKNFLGGELTGAWNAIGNVVKGIWSGIQTSVKNGINIVIGIINGMIKAINGLHINLPKVGPFGGGSIGFNIPLIPQLASGGLVNKGGLALVGEKGPEVVYLPGGASVLPNPQTNRINNQQAHIITVQLNVDGKKLAETTVKHLPNIIRHGTGARAF